MSNAQALANDLDARYLLPTLDWWERGWTPLRVDYVVIVSVSGSFATVQFADGTRAAMPYGIITPAAGERWRSLKFWRQAPILDDLSR